MAATKLCSPRAREVVRCCFSFTQTPRSAGRGNSWRVSAWTAGLSTSLSVSKDPSTPPKAGDRGPSRNYQRKMAKKAKRRSTEGGSVAQLESLLEGMKLIDLDKGGVVDTHDQDTPPDLRDLLSGLKLTSTRERDHERRPPDASDFRGRPSNCQFLDPSAGPRLGLFTKPRVGVSQAPEQPTYAEVDEGKRLQALLLLRPWCFHDSVMEANRTLYPRQFPIDNENYNQGEEASVGFEDHVLLDHLIADFPKKGPVRHFMELVVTGLSKNPHYTAREKREMVDWYRHYFSQFSDSTPPLTPS